MTKLLSIQTAFGTNPTPRRSRRGRATSSASDLRIWVGAKAATLEPGYG
jgi:hypothetical protein